MLRRTALAALAAAALIAPALLGVAPAHAQPAPGTLGPAEPFSFDILVERAETLARLPYTAPQTADPAVLEQIDYDAHWRIRFRPEATVRAGDVPVQFFHLGTFFRAPVALHIVEGDAARPVLYTQGYFDKPDDSPARALPPDAGFAGFRIMRPDLKTDWISFLGAAYFRTDGPVGQYGQSARGLALDTGLPKPEEFPRFTAFWIEPGEAGDAGHVVIHALMDSPSVTGAYRMAIRHRDGAGQVMDIDSRLFFRAPVERVGVAPLTSMFWYSESNRFTAMDWRPEVHDTDGLMIHTGTGERIWRPLNNPPRVVTSSFADENPRGFGLMKRDRAFENYQDDGVFYDRRPSVWIEPVGDWGRGAVQLIEIPTDDEIYDNIVAFWNPAEPPAAGGTMAFRYRLHWALDAPDEPMPVARTVATRIGHGGVPGQPRPEGQIKVALDFEGGRVADYGQGMGVTPVVSVPEGVELINPYALPVVGTARWRLIFDIKAPPGTETTDLRAYLAVDGVPLTETWLGQIHPAQIDSYR